MSSAPPGENEDRPISRPPTAIPPSTAPPLYERPSLQRSERPASPPRSFPPPDEHPYMEPHTNRYAPQSHIYKSSTSSYPSAPSSRQNPRPPTSLWTIPEHAPATRLFDPDLSDPPGRSRDSKHVSQYFTRVDTACNPQSDERVAVSSPGRVPVSTTSCDNMTRPYTAPAGPDDDILTRLIPPRRELPFSRQTSVQRLYQDEQDRPSSRPASSSLDQLPPLPTPKFAYDAGRMRPSSASIAGQAGSASSKPAPKKRSQSTKAAPAKALLGESSLKGFFSVTKDPLASSLAAKRPLTEVAVNERNVKILRIEGRERMAETRDENRASTPDDSSRTLGAAIEDFGVADNAGVAPDSGITPDAAALSAYAEPSYDLRMGDLENMIIGLLEDDNFVTLCEDVNSCWRRIGLEARVHQ
ncbi:hypothetical protein LTS18_004621 [Coniosporium uncinatum]|uniref:Uncharacterized protein n=1 Tax=Coniosporium uncinatum TaxID=93489 RepID=A0ACC3D5Q0_9PEZI|nr:hypothetical protein LTS18_004621 [Coniosporium uncinatum]